MKTTTKYCTCPNRHLLDEGQVCEICMLLVGKEPISRERRHWLNVVIHLNISYPSLDN